MRQITLSKKDIKGLNSEISTHYGIDEFFSKDDFVALADDTYVLRDGEIIFFYKEDLLLPSLRLIIQSNFLKNVVINMGAVPFIAKGADLMRPGIVGVDAYVEEGNIVAIVDEKNLKPIAIGQSLFSKDEIQGMEVGKVVLNLHHVGDEVWNFTTGPE
ncbi:RNA-binding protein [Candidatus Woesearchaeota archaeon]|nr:RNA-binding protein [Candidatus Woesearchaeota archaeon]